MADFTSWKKARYCLHEGKLYFMIYQTVPPGTICPHCQRYLGDQRKPLNKGWRLLMVEDQTPGAEGLPYAKFLGIWACNDTHAEKALEAYFVRKKA